MRVALIMAGGGGTRLWPASTPERPKQYVDLDGGGPLLRRTVERLSGLVESEHVWVVTGPDQADAVASCVPEIPRAQIICEPQGRNTAPCVALGLRHLERAYDDDATVMVLPADHHIADPAGFQRHLLAACRHAETAQCIVTLGIEATRADTGYGYIERGPSALPAVDGGGEPAAFPALRFVEKPDAETAQAYLDQGTFLWNAGIFVAPTRRFGAEFERLRPDLWAALEPVRDGSVDAAATAFANATPEPIDIAIMEAQEDLRTIPTSVGWTDLGSWQAVAELLAQDSAGNARRVEGGELRTLDAQNNLIWSSGHDVGVVGVEGLAIIAVGNRVMVCPVEQAQRVKELLTQPPT